MASVTDSPTETQSYNDTSEDQQYYLIGLGSLLFVVCVIALATVLKYRYYCRPNHRAARSTDTTNQTAGDEFTDLTQQADEESGIILEKMDDEGVTSDAMDEQRNVYSDEPSQALANNEEETERTSLSTLEKQNNYIVIDEYESGGETDKEEHYESSLSDTECGYSTIDELSADDEDSEEGIYHDIDVDYTSQQSSNERSETDSIYAVIKDLFELPPEPNDYLSVYGSSDDEQSESSHWADLSDVESEHSYTTIDEWKRKSTDKSSDVAIIEDEAGYLVITDTLNKLITSSSEREQTCNYNEEDQSDDILCTHDQME